MKIGIAQINSKVGDFPYNAKRILQVYRASLDEGADLVITPAFALCGAPLLGLARQEKFANKCLQALDYLGDEVKDVPLLVGHITTINGETQPAASLLKRGEKPITKTGEGNHIIFSADELKLPNLSHALCIAAIPYQANQKASSRIQLDEDFIFCNAVGANDGIVYNGDSCVKTAKKTTELLPPIEESHTVIDLSDLTSIDGFSEKPESISHLRKALVTGIKDFVYKGGYNGACFYWDGSLESHLTLHLASQAEVPLTILHEKGSPSPSVQEHIHLEPIVLKQLESEAATLFPESTDVHDQIKLMAVRNTCVRDGLLQLSTGNNTDYLMGNCANMELDYGGLAILADLPVTLATHLAQWIQSHINDIPDTVLDESKKRAEQDAVLKLTLSGKTADEIIKERDVSEHLVRSIFRKYNLSHQKRRFTPLKIHVISHPENSLEFMPVNQSFVD